MTPKDHGGYTNSSLLESDLTKVEDNTSCPEVSYIHTYIYIRLLTTSPKGLFSANYKEKDKNKNIYKLFKVTIANNGNFVIS